MQSALVAGERLNEILELEAEKGDKEYNKVSLRDCLDR